MDGLRGLNGVRAVGSTFNFPLRLGPENSLLVHFYDDPDPARNVQLPAAHRQPGVLCRDGDQAAGRPRLQHRRPAGFTASGRHQSGVCADVSGRQGSAHDAIQRGLSRNQPAGRLDHHRRRRGRAAAFAEPRGGTGLLHLVGPGRTAAPIDRRADRQRRLARSAIGDRRSRTQAQPADVRRHRACRGYRGRDDQPAAARHDVDAVFRCRCGSARRRRNLRRHRLRCCAARRSRWRYASRSAQHPAAFSG